MQCGVHWIACFYKDIKKTPHIIIIFAGMDALIDLFARQSLDIKNRKGYLNADRKALAFLIKFHYFVNARNS